MKATLTYYGHSCFKLEADGHSIVFDPYEDGSVPGLKLPRGLMADIVNCSHEHGDHNAAHLVKLTGEKPQLNIKKIRTPHDHHNGTHRGFSDITFVLLPGITVCHLGDLGRIPTDEEYQEIEKADVILIPCAGYFTINSKEAAKVIGHLKHPALKVLMHFRENGKGYDVQESIREVMEDIHGVERLKGTSITVDSESIPDKIITLEAEQ